MPDSMREFVEKRSSEGNFSTPTEYVRHLIRQDQKLSEKNQLETKLLEALDSGKFDEVTAEFFEDLRSHARGRKSKK
jgi:antitoxin ParD1/3/4